MGCGVCCSGFRVRGLGFRVKELGLGGFDLGFGVWCLGFRVSGFSFRISGFEFQVSGFGFRVSGFKSQVSGFGFRVSGFRFRVSGFGVRVPGFGFWVFQKRRGSAGFPRRGCAESAPRRSPCCPGMEPSTSHTKTGRRPHFAKRATKTKVEHDRAMAVIVGRVSS